MDTRLKDIVSRENRNSLFAFLGAQCFNIIVTLLIAWLMFGIVKPALWPTTPEVAKVEEAAEESEFRLKVVNDSNLEVEPTDSLEIVKITVKE
jgi:hypothetical protein